MSNNLRDENGTLIGGLVVFDYMDGISDFESGKPPPDMTSPSYDLGRQRAAEKREQDVAFKTWLKRDEDQRMERLKALLPADAFAELEQKILAIRAETKKPRQPEG